MLVAGWSDEITTGMDYYVVAYDPGLLNPPTSLVAQATNNTSVKLDWTRNSVNEDGFSIEDTGDVAFTSTQTSHDADFFSAFNN